MKEDMNRKDASAGRYTEDIEAEVNKVGTRERLSWGFYVLVAAGVWAVAELLQSVLYFFN